MVVQIVDARNPLLFRCQDLADYVKEVDTHKENLLLVNKADFLTEEQRDVWAKYFKELNINAVFYSATLANTEIDSDTPDNPDIQQSTEEIEANEDDSLQRLAINDNDPPDITSQEGLEASVRECQSDLEQLTSSQRNTTQTVDENSSHAQANFIHSNYINSPKLLNRKELIEVFENFYLGPKLHPSRVTIGLVGYPNVGKSFSINSLLREKKTAVSATPGKTKHFQVA